jgi:hypothetical protein
VTGSASRAGRFVPGVGHGLPAWIDQIGALPPKTVRALEETVTAVRRLLAGETVTTEGDYVRLREVRLEHPPDVAPPVLLGVRRPFGLRPSVELVAIRVGEFAVGVVRVPERELGRQPVAECVVDLSVEAAW